MAREVRHYKVTVPAGTPQATPQITDVSFDVRIVRRIDWHLPHGCVGLVGFHIAMGGVPVVPLPKGEFVIGDGEGGSWTLEDAPDSGAWQCVAYNTGGHAHTIHLTFHLDLLHRAPKLIVPIDPALIERYNSQLAAWRD